MKLLLKRFVLILVALACLATQAPLSAVVHADAPEPGLGLLRSTGRLPAADITAVSDLSLAALPSKVDLRGDLPPIANQGSQNSCVAWAVAYYYKTFQERVQYGWDVNTRAHQFSPAFIYNQRPTSDCSRDVGMSLYAGFNIVQNLGAATLDVFPVSASDSCTQPSATVRAAALAYRSESFGYLFIAEGSANLAQLKALLAQGQPFVIAVPVYTSFRAADSDDPVVPRPQPKEKYYGGHAMLVVGYDDAMGGFLVANSWGRDWGRDGYGYLAYDFVQYDAWEAWIMQDRVDVAEVTTFYGAALLDGVQVSAGTSVAAWVNGLKVAETQTYIGQDGAAYELDVPGDNPYTPSCEGGASGTVVRLTVAGWSAAQAGWNPGQREHVDLYASSAPLIPRSYLPIIAQN